MTEYKILGLSDKKYESQRISLEKDIEELEYKLNRIQVIEDLIDKKEQLTNDIIEGLSKINNDPIIPIINNIIEEDNENYIC